jgi:hypothetical protein
MDFDENELNILNGANPIWVQPTPRVRATHTVAPDEGGSERKSLVGLRLVLVIEKGGAVASIKHRDVGEAV